MYPTTRIIAAASLLSYTLKCYFMQAASASPTPRTDKPPPKVAHHVTLDPPNSGPIITRQLEGKETLIIDFSSSYRHVLLVDDVKVS